MVFETQAFHVPCSITVGVGCTLGYTGTFIASAGPCPALPGIAISEIQTNYGVPANILVLEMPVAVRMLRRTLIWWHNASSPVLRAV